MTKLVVLAYSGGLDTSAIVPWLRETEDAEVICYTADLGQGAPELEGIREKAKRAGAVDCVVEGLKEQFVSDFVLPALMAGAVYSRKYLLGTALARPLLAAAQVALARRVGAAALAHGCTGKGNDQVRFELTYRALAPELEIIAPWRRWEFRGRSDLVRYLKARGVAWDVPQQADLSRDRNLWHCSHEGGCLEDPATEPPEEIYRMTRTPEDAPEQPATVSVAFTSGMPVSLNGTPLSPAALLERLNELAGRHGVGRADVVEDRLVGIKSRGVYETPGGSVLRMAHRELEQLVLDRRTLQMKDELSARYGDLVYEGRWWSTEREALDGLVEVTQRNVTGRITLKLYKGSTSVVSRESPFSLYSPQHATFEADGVYDHRDASGFIKLFGMATQLSAQHPTSGVRPMTAA